MSQFLTELHKNIPRVEISFDVPRLQRGYIERAGLAGPPGGLLPRSMSKTSASPMLRGLFENSAAKGLPAPVVRPRTEYTVEEARRLAEQGVEEWVACLPKDDWSDIVDKGTPLRWVDGKGWVEG